MRLESRIRNCLYLSWALPADALPPLPTPLRYQTVAEAGETFAFASALFFRQERARFAAFPTVGLSFPQFNLRFYVLDDHDLPSVFFHRLFVPLWAMAPLRLMTQQPVHSARFRYPRSGNQGPWEWTVRQRHQARCRRHQASCRAEPGSPEIGYGPSLGSWEATVAFFRQRDRGYSASRSGLHLLQTEQPTVEAIPVVVELLETDLLEACTPGLDWPPLHCAFLCPDIPLQVELGTSRSRPLAQQAAVPG